MSEHRQTEKTATPWSVIHKLAERLADDSAIGERAWLRRLDYSAPDRPEFWKIAVGELEPILVRAEPDRDGEERRWAALIAGLAELAGAKLHRRGRPLGDAAAAAKIHETRFIRLLRAHDDALLSLVRPFARQLAARGEAVDWSDMARLVLSDGRSTEEQVRQDLARGYFAALRKQSTSTQEPTV